MKNRMIPKITGIKQHKLKGFDKAIQDEMVQLTNDRVYVPVKEESMIS